MADEQHVFTGNLVVLERVVEDFIPTYSVYGLSACIRCKNMVYVGHETARTLADEEMNVHPICVECIQEVDAETPGGIHKNKLGRVEDGACPNCGEVHAP